jgi:hypothetical protein
MKAFLKNLAEHPEAVRFAIVEVLAAGPKPLARRDAALCQVAGFLESARPADVTLRGAAPFRAGTGLRTGVEW